MRQVYDELVHPLPLYGNPIFVGMNWTDFLGMSAVAIVLLIIGLIQFRYVDIERG